MWSHNQREPASTTAAGRITRTVDSSDVETIASFLAVSAQLFVSYSHADRTYVQQLVAHLARGGVSAWADGEIITGDRWTSIIRNQIDACAAMIVVMTPAAEESVWVEREISRAEEQRKPIFPLLLKGQPFFRLTNLQYEKVDNNAMPGVGFVGLLKEVADSYQEQRVAAGSGVRGSGILSIPSELMIAGLLSPVPAKESALVVYCPISWSGTLNLTYYKWGSTADYEARTSAPIIGRDVRGQEMGIAIFTGFRAAEGQSGASHFKIAFNNKVLATGIELRLGKVTELDFRRTTL